MGRTKPDSIELENKPSDSHVARTDQDEFGNIFRRNMPYGDVDDHGTVFVGFSADQKRLSRMLDSMAGLVNGTARCAHTLHPAVDRLLLLRALPSKVCDAYGKTTSKNATTVSI